MGRVWGGGFPSPVGVGSGEWAMPLPRNFLDFCVEIIAFWCTFAIGVSPTSEKNSELFSHRSGAA